MIYLNSSQLHLGTHKPEAGAGKSMTTVFHHEFGHFLGFRHSRSKSSLMAPAGFNEEWDLGGEDGTSLERYGAKP